MVRGVAPDQDKFRLELSEGENTTCLRFPMALVDMRFISKQLLSSYQKELLLLLG